MENFQDASKIPDQDIQQEPAEAVIEVEPVLLAGAGTLAQIVGPERADSFIKQGRINKSKSYRLALRFFNAR